MPSLKFCAVLNTKKKSHEIAFSVNDHSYFSLKPSYLGSKSLKVFVFLWFGIVLHTITYRPSTPLSEEEKVEVKRILANEEE